MELISVFAAKLAADANRGFPLDEQIRRADPFILRWIEAEGEVSVRLPALAKTLAPPVV